ncbi:unnamed protein product [Alopecurus aequalis]
MEWEPEQLNLGALGFAGICRETYRVLLRAILPNKGGRGAAVLTAFFLASHALDSPDLALGAVAYNLSKLVCMLLIFLLSIIYTAEYALRVATLYCTDDDAHASDRIVREVPEAPRDRLILISVTVLPLANLYITLSALAWVELPQLDPSDKVVALALQLLGGAAFLAGAAYVVVLFPYCLHGGAAGGFGGRARPLHRAQEPGAPPREVLGRGSRLRPAGRLLRRSANVSPGSGVCRRAGPRTRVPGGRGGGHGRGSLGGGAVMLVAQPVVYLVCKNHHNEVVDKVHLNYIGEYQRLAVDGDSGVELQPVEATPQPTATSAQATPTAAPSALLRATSAQE